MLIIKELVLAPTRLDEGLKWNLFLSDATLPNLRSIDFAAALKFGSDSVAQATKPSGLTSTAVKPLSSLAGWRHISIARSKFDRGRGVSRIDAFKAGDTLPLLQKRNQGNKPTHDYDYNFHVIHETRRQ